MNQNIFNDNNPIIVERNNKLSIIAIIVLVLLGIYVVNNAKTIINSMPSKEQKNPKYKLVKYSDYNKKFTYLDDVNFFEDYLVLIGYNHGDNNKNILDVFKNGKKIDSGVEDEKYMIDRVGNSNVYSIKNNVTDKSVSIIDIVNNGSLKGTYDEIIEDGNSLLIKKNNKIGVLDNNGNIIIDLIYDYIESGYMNNEYFLVSINEKVGIVDNERKIIIPINYDFESSKYGYPNLGSIVYDEKDAYFLLKQNDEFYVLDSKNNVIINSSKEIEYDSKINHFIIYNPDNNSSEYYNTKGELVIEFSNDPYSFEYQVFSQLENNVGMLLFTDKNDDSTVYTIDKNLNKIKYDNVIHTLNDNYTKTIEYFINKNIYATKENGKYYLKNTKDNEVIDNYVSINTQSLLNNDKIIIACKEENKCGIVNLLGRPLTAFIYKPVKNLVGRYISLENNKKSIIISRSEYKELNCKINEEINTIDEGILVGVKNKYNNKCEIVNASNITNFNIIENGFMIKNHWTIFDNKGNRIYYDNKDKVNITQYLKINDNKMYFLTDKGIYFIEKK